MTHEELEAYGYGNEIIFKDLEEEIMRDIVRRIKKAGEISGSTAYLMEQLLYMGYDDAQIKAMVQDALGASDEYIDELYAGVLAAEYIATAPIFEATGKILVPFKGNAIMQNLLSFAKRVTKGEMRNMTQSLGFVKKTSDGTKAVGLTKFYQETMDKALMEVATGTFSLDRALNDAVNVMVNSGVRWIDYESGHHNRIAVAARRSVMSGLAQASQQQTLDLAKELDIHTFEVSAHMGARPSHAEWQGKVYTDEELVSVCGLGEVTGLLGANCYHTYEIFMEGVSTRKYSDKELEEWKNDTPTEYQGKEYTNYEARQRMRQMETNMRAQKEKIKLLEEGGASKEVIDAAKARYRKQMSEYEDFSEAMNLKTQKERITIGDGKTMKGVKAAKIDEGFTPQSIFRATTRQNEQFERYRKVLGDSFDMPNNVEKFLEKKYTNSVWWKQLQSDYGVVSQYEPVTIEIDGEKIEIDKVPPEKIVSMHRRMKDIRAGFPSGFKNKPTMAICEADGKEYWAYSGLHNENSKPYKNNKVTDNLSNVVFLKPKDACYFKTLIISKPNGQAWDRYVDAEAKLFEFLADQEVGSIYLVVDLDMCESCKGVLKQFKDKFPNIKISIAQKRKR